ncbi:hypothetical protein [Bacillus taeanensis]|uniref:Uncharacterized protein n=1 Tax=Bacillus taeanensis TaxID=273032 RepID=A0A366XRH1_9BACI|nr:hypothetical protein [Bacillus taeanensis]RBW68296.1 hypothetical protein DS031_17390 [Bacillus taeanensis]
MNNLAWIFNVGRGVQQILQMFGNRRNNRGGMMLSLLGLGMGAAAYGMTRRRRNGNAPQPAVQPIRNMVTVRPFGKYLQNR